MTQRLGDETVVPVTLDEATIDVIARNAYSRSGNMATNTATYDELSVENQRRVREVVEDVLGALTDLGAVVVTVQTETERRAEEIRKLVEADQQENVCRCPVLTVGDYCPVHGG